MNSKGFIIILIPIVIVFAILLGFYVFFASKTVKSNVIGSVPVTTVSGSTVYVKDSNGDKELLFRTLQTKSDDANNKEGLTNRLLVNKLGNTKEHLFFVRDNVLVKVNKVAGGIELIEIPKLSVKPHDHFLVDSIYITKNDDVQIFGIYTKGYTKYGFSFNPDSNEFTELPPFDHTTNNKYSQDLYKANDFDYSFTTLNDAVGGFLDISYFELASPLVSNFDSIEVNFTGDESTLEGIVDVAGYEFDNRVLLLTREQINEQIPNDDPSTHYDFGVVTIDWPMFSVLDKGEIITVDDHTLKLKIFEVTSYDKKKYSKSEQPVNSFYVLFDISTGNLVQTK